MKALVLSTLLVVAASFSVHAQKDYRIAKWQGDKQVALSFTFDDSFERQFTLAAPILNAKDYQATFFLMTGAANWSLVQSVLDSGHEVASHGLSDVNFRNLDTTQVRNQLANSLKAIQDSLIGERVRAISWPQGGGGGSLAYEDTLRAMALSYYPFARNAGSAAGFDGYRHYTNSFFTAPGRNYYQQLGAYAITSTSTAQDIVQLIQQATPDTGRINLLFHAIGEPGYATLDSLTFHAMVDSVNAYEKDVWVGTFSSVSAYHRQYRAAFLDFICTADGGSCDDYIEFDPSLPDSIYDEPMTIIYKKPNFPVDSIGSDSGLIPYQDLGDSLMFDVKPKVRFWFMGTTQLAAERLNEQLIVYPNPSKGVLHFKGLDARYSQVTIRDMMGREVAMLTVSENASIDLPQASGNYLLEFKAKDNSLPILRKRVTKVD